MQVVFHLGVHATDEDRLLKGLLKNTDRLQAAGILVPGPSHYRRLLIDAMAQTRQGGPAPEEETTLITEIIDGADTPDRLILSFDSFLSGPARIFQQDKLYAVAGKRVAGLSRTMPSAKLEFHLATRNPATFVPAVLRANRKIDADQVLQRIDPSRLAWSDVVRQIREANPGARIVVWANEDAPVIWSDILSALSGIDAGAEPFHGTYDLLESLLTKEGSTNLKAYLHEHPPTGSEERRRMSEVFLEHYADTNETEEEVDLPNWSDADVARTTAHYEEDLDAIAAMERVEVLLP